MDSYLEQLQRAIAAATRGMTSEELTRHPRARPNGTWCMAEVLEHLYLTYTGTVKGPGAVSAGRKSPGQSDHPEAASANIAGDWAELFSDVVESHRNAPVPRACLRTKSWRKSDLRSPAMGALLAECESRHGAATRVMDHPILGPLTARQWRKFHWVHGRHHVKQILKLRRVVSALAPITQRAATSSISLAATKRGRSRLHLRQNLLAVAGRYA